MITSVTVRPNEGGAGWFVIVDTSGPGKPICVGSPGGFPLIDMSQVQAEASRWVARMLLGHGPDDE